MFVECCEVYVNLLTLRIHMYTIKVYTKVYERNDFMRGGPDFKDRFGHPDEHHRGGRRRGEKEEKRYGAKTFRRGRALAFYEIMSTKSASLKKQLETPELQTIHPILVGELKAVESLMDEFAHLFELVEVDETPQDLATEAESLDEEAK